jgi:hypothetical protein
MAYKYHINTIKMLTQVPGYPDGSGGLGPGRAKKGPVESLG